MLAELFSTVRAMFLSCLELWQQQICGVGAYQWLFGFCKFYRNDQLILQIL